MLHFGLLFVLIDKIEACKNKKAAAKQQQQQLQIGDTEIKQNIILLIKYEEFLREKNAQMENICATRGCICSVSRIFSACSAINYMILLCSTGHTSFKYLRYTPKRRLLSNLDEMFIILRNVQFDLCSSWI